jgi:hypothetical protein
MTIRCRQLTEFPEAEIIRAMGPYSYGKGVERTTEQLVGTLARGLLQIAAGFHVGGTLTMILRDIGFITPGRGTLTRAGREFMFDCYNGSRTTYVPAGSAQAPLDREPAAQGGNADKPATVLTGGLL